MSGIDSDSIDSDGKKIKVKEKSKGMDCYAYLKFTNTLLYNLTLSFALGYFFTTKFTSEFTFYMFSGLLIARPSLIALYSLAVICLESLSKKTAKKALKRAKKKNDGLSDSDMSDLGGSSVDGNPDFMNNSSIMSQHQNKVFDSSGVYSHSAQKLSGGLPGMGVGPVMNQNGIYAQPMSKNVDIYNNAAFAEDSLDSEMSDASTNKGSKGKPTLKSIKKKMKKDNQARQ